METTSAGNITVPSPSSRRFLRRSARRDGIPDGRSGAVVIIQRFGGALNLNVHLHALVLDGVFAVEGSGVAFHPLRRLTRQDMAGVVALIARRVERLLERRGLAGGAQSSGAPDLWSEEAPILAAVAAASVEEDASRAGPSRPGGYQWAELMRRTFGHDVLGCPTCAGVSGS